MFSQEPLKELYISIRKPVDLQRLCVRSEVSSPHVFPPFNVAVSTDNKKKAEAQYVLRTIEARSCNHFYSEKAIMNTYSVCVFVALFIQHATRLRSIILSSVAFPALQYFYTLSHKRMIFGKKRY
jgi:hypothetical protein